MRLEKKQKTILYIVMIIVYVIAHVIMISHHEAWGDEAQAWNIAKNTSILSLFPALCAEGHPAGWFIVIKIFQTLGFSFYSFSYLSLFLMTAALGIFLFKSPLPLYIKIIVSVSSCFCYFNPVICRVYSFAVLLIVLSACFYDLRKEKSVIFGILVFLLFQSHILLAGFASCLLIILISDCIKDKKLYPGMIISALGFLATAAELYPRPSVVKSVDYSSSDILSQISVSSFFERLKLFPTALFTSFADVWWILFVTAFICLTIVLVITASKNLDVLLIEICSFGFVVLVNFIIYKITIHAATLLIAVMLFISWILYPRLEGKAHRIVSILALCVICLGSIHTWVRSARSDYYYDFSENKKMADYICANVPQSGIIIMKDEELARAGVYAYVSSARPDITFFCPDTGEEYTFYNWSTTVSPIDNSAAISLTKERFPNTDDIYIISWHEEDEDGIALVFAANDFCEKNDPSWLYRAVE